jgi:hypothetical protein
MRRVLCISAGLAAILFAVSPHVVSGAASSDADQAPRPVRVTLRDGSSKVVRLDGVGCDESICSRVAVVSRTVGNIIMDRTRFETIAAVREIADNSAVFVLRDGRIRRVSVVPDNRVLYVIAADGRRQKIGLRELQSIDFTPREFVPGR